MSKIYCSQAQARNSQSDNLNNSGSTNVGQNDKLDDIIVMIILYVLKFA